MTTLLALSLASGAAAELGSVKKLGLTPFTIEKTVTVKASREEVWRLWATSDGAMEFFAPKAVIGDAVGGPYEIYFDLTDERQGTKGLKIVDRNHPGQIGFEWNAPPDMPEVRKKTARVFVSSTKVSGEKRKVTLTHYLTAPKGADLAEWKRAQAFFDRAWSIVMERFERRVKTGPIDWSKEK